MKGISHYEHGSGFSPEGASKARILIWHDHPALRTCTARTSVLGSAQSEAIFTCRSGKLYQQVQPANASSVTASGTNAGLEKLPRTASTYKSMARQKR